MQISHDSCAPVLSQASSLQQSASRSANAAFQNVQGVSNRSVPLRLEYQAARQVGPALACRCVSPSSTAGGYTGPYPRPMHHLATVTHVLLGHAGGERLPSTPEQSAVCSFLHCLNTNHRAALQPGQHDPFMLLPQQQDAQGHSLLYLAVCKGLNGLLEWLLNTQPPSFSVMALFTGQNDEQITPLHLAITKGNESMVSVFVEKNTDVNVRDCCNETLQHWVARRGYETIVRLLLNKNADINAQNDFRRTPLHSVAMKGYESIAHLLLDNNADVDRQDCRGASPLHCAVEMGREGMVCLLTDRGADINLRDNNGRSPLHKAINQGNKKMVCFLVGKGADVNLPYVFGEYPLHWAVERGYESVASVLLDKCTDVNIQNNFGQSPLSCAVNMRYESIVCLLVDRGADIHKEDIFKQSPLSLAIKNGDTRIVQLLENRRALQEPD